MDACSTRSKMQPAGLISSRSFPLPPLTASRAGLSTLYLLCSAGWAHHDQFCRSHTSRFCIRGRAGHAVDVRVQAGKRDSVSAREASFSQTLGRDGRFPGYIGRRGYFGRGTERRCCSKYVFSIDARSLLILFIAEDALDYIITRKSARRSKSLERVSAGAGMALEISTRVKLEETLDELLPLLESESESEMPLSAMAECAARKFIVTSHSLLLILHQSLHQAKHPQSFLITLISLLEQYLSWSRRKHLWMNRAMPVQKLNSSQPSTTNSQHGRTLSVKRERRRRVNR